MDRLYRTDFGRWLTHDPIEERGGINLYDYVGNNPVNWIDPLGLCRNKGESFYNCLDRHAKEFYGGALDLSDNLGYYGLAAAGTGLAMDTATSLIDKGAENAQKNAQLAAVDVEGSMFKKVAVAEAGAAKSVRLMALRGTLAAVSKASGVAGALATGFSAGARAGFVGDCLKECPCGNK